MRNDDNTQVFDLAKRTADMLVKMFGRRCEVVVHDFQDLKKSLIYIAGNVTNRTIGSPITDLVLTELRKDPSEIEDIPNYKTQARNGTLLKSATVFLRDTNEKVIGALCINYDISQMELNVRELEDFLSFNVHEDKSENFHTTVQDVIHDMVHQVLANFKKAHTQLSLEEKVECVRLLEEKGAFLIKGSTEYLASVLGVSKFTIYNYLNKIRTQNEYQFEEDIK
ncbi:helix-turn-helix transcriptional regulator [Robertmurraya massiliosenegalensis]|uniref:helix-turn-helix transcriptional regulator n=1 Tax=Robertmurraya massiliosenegalensis TaxID=1287657 RepID=UPI0002E00113|nr:PAS domain-containing protein [Robertmurraya massiliosenegalensis]